jgi:hypothetical protein
MMERILSVVWTCESLLATGKKGDKVCDHCHHVAKNTRIHNPQPPLLMQTIHHRTLQWNHRSKCACRVLKDRVSKGVGVGQRKLRGAAASKVADELAALKEVDDAAAASAASKKVEAPLQSTCAPS